MAASDLINLSVLIDDAKCFASVRQHRWPEGACGSVANSGRGHTRGREREVVLLGSHLEEPGNQGNLRLHVATAHVVNLPLPDHRHHLVTRQRPFRGFQAAEAKPRPDQPFDRPVILLHDVVQVFALPQL
jgi:hypothetical protein